MVHSQLDDLDLDPFEFRAYAHMVRRAGGYSGEHYEGVVEGAKRCRMNAKTYRRALAGLVARRLVTREERTGQTTVYRLTPPSAWLPLPNQAEVATPTPTESGTPTGNGSPTTSGRGTPTESGTPPLPNQVGKGNPLKVVPLREPKGAQARRSPGKSGKGRKPKFDPATVPLPDFVSRDWWTAFCTHRAEIDKPLTEAAVKLTLSDLAKHPLDADEMLRTSISRGWTGVFPLSKGRDASGESPASAAWDEILAAARKGKLPELDAPAKAALQAVGGFPAVAYGDERGLGLLRKRFLDAYGSKAAA